MRMGKWLYPSESLLRYGGNEGLLQWGKGAADGDDARDSSGGCGASERSQEWAARLWKGHEELPRNSG